MSSEVNCQKPAARCAGSRDPFRIRNTGRNQMVKDFGQPDICLGDYVFTVTNAMAPATEPGRLAVGRRSSVV